MLEADLYSYLTQHPDFIAEVSTRLFPRRLPQEPVLPAATYMRVSTRAGHDLSGPDGLPRARFQFTAWAKTPLEARRVGESLRRILDGYKGYVGTTWIDACFWAGDRDVDDNTTGRAGVANDFLVHYFD